MTRYRIILILFVMALIGSVSTHRAIYLSLAAALFGLLALSVLWAHLSIRWMRLSRRSLARVGQVGQMLEEEFALTNSGILPKLWVEVQDESDLPNHYASRALSWLHGKNWRGWRVRTLCTARGRFRLGPVKLTSGDPLGVYQRTRTLPTFNNLLVYPATYDLPRFPLRSTFVPGGEAIRKRAQHTTTNAAGVRDYVNGDSLNRIHWPLSARRNKLTVKEFELDPTSDYWIFLDMQRDAQAALSFSTESLDDNPSYMLPPSTEEYAVSLAASVARHFIREGRTVGFLAYAGQRQIVQPDRGERQQNKIFETLAVIKSGGDVPFDRVVRSEGTHLARGSTVVAISSSPAASWGAAAAQLNRNGSRVVAIVIDRATFGATGVSARMDDVTTALVQGGVITRTVKFGDGFAEALS